MAERLNVMQRLNAVQQKVSYVQKDKKAGMTYSIVSHDAVTALVRPHMVDNGVLYWPVRWSVSHNGNRCEGQGAVRFCAIDDRDDFIDVEVAGYGIDNQDKGPGKAQSYAVKYALLKCLGLESGDDPDQDQVTKHESDSYTVHKGDIEMAIDETALQNIGARISADHRDGLLSNEEALTLKSIYAQKLRTLRSPK